MSTNLAEARSLSRRDRRPSRTRDRNSAERSSSRLRAGHPIKGEDDGAANQRLEDRRPGCRGSNRQSTKDNERSSTDRRSARRRSRSSSTEDDDHRTSRNREHARKSFDLSDRRRIATLTENPPDQGRSNYRRADSNNSGDHSHVGKRASQGGASEGFPATGRISNRRQSSPHSGIGHPRVPTASTGRAEPRAYKRTDESQQLELDGQDRRENLRHRREVRERPRPVEETRNRSAIQSSQCLMECDRDDPLANIAATVIQSEQDNAKKLADQEQARKIADRTALREKRRLERERMERERGAAEAQATVVQAAAVRASTQKATMGPTDPEKAVISEAQKAVGDSNQISSRARAFSVHGGTECPDDSASAEADSASGKSRSVSRRKPVEPTAREEDAAKLVQTPRRTLVVRDSAIPVDTNHEDRVILVSGIDDEGAKAKKPSDYKREASTGLTRKRSVNNQAAVTASTPQQSGSRSAKVEKTTASPFRPCPGFAGVEGSNELMKALAFRRQKTMGTEKAYHATGNNSNLLCDDQVVKTGSNDSDDDDGSLSEGGPDR